MNLIYQRRYFGKDGVFGEVIDEHFSFLFVALEHAYLNEEEKLEPKIPVGEYKCIRGEHKLHDMEKPFTTFEVMGVPGHTGILFHIGNYNEDSDGCILIGKGFGRRSDGGRMIVASKQSFKKFMELQDGVDEFTLKVEGSI